MKTMIAISARGAGHASKRNSGHGSGRDSEHGSGHGSERDVISEPHIKKERAVLMDKNKLQKLSDQLTDLVEELNEIREDLDEMYSDMEYNCPDDQTESEEILLNRMEEICATVGSAFTDLNEALDEMEELL